MESEPLESPLHAPRPLAGRRVGVFGLTWLSFWIPPPPRSVLTPPPRPTGLGGTRSERLLLRSGDEGERLPLLFSLGVTEIQPSSSPSAIVLSVTCLGFGPGVRVMVRVWG